MAIPATARTGPILIAIEYRVSPACEARFLRAIAERRRVRLRDGARDWELVQDLANPEIWVEQFFVATWVEYVRHNQRRTKADAGNWAELRSFSVGDDGPRWGVKRERWRRFLAFVTAAYHPAAGQFEKHR